MVYYIVDRAFVNLNFIETDFYLQGSVSSLCFSCLSDVKSDSNVLAFL
jgi:hypothetical protein